MGFSLYCFLTTIANHFVRRFSICAPTPTPMASQRMDTTSLFAPFHQSAAHILFHSFTGVFLCFVFVPAPAANFTIRTTSVIFVVSKPAFYTSRYCANTHYILMVFFYITVALCFYQSQRFNKSSISRARRICDQSLPMRHPNQN